VECYQGTTKVDDALCTGAKPISMESCKDGDCPKFAGLSEQQIMIIGASIVVFLLLLAS
jgi:hypothetical protein